ncbi:hypothetical protein A2164_01520 [Candidatus Curtissbacteria bacterium RBG_13_35_7]|uniref:Uncharacterized protein n=1 Tax=Candidatus Curtissbacteria bacterium RBG_13_35_7 TaxID=1797705 RepID=A0A1F5G2N6_9BACT|nr:MAG: hypothetical protein A2164_01520 [Candidatus Curtissbacteria bacterium RBG_13_35_7]
MSTEAKTTIDIQKKSTTNITLYSFEITVLTYGAVQAVLVTSTAVPPVDVQHQTLVKRLKLSQ